MHMNMYLNVYIYTYKHVYTYMRTYSQVYLSLSLSLLPLLLSHTQPHKRHLPLAQKFMGSQKKDIASLGCPRHFDIKLTQGTGGNTFAFALTNLRRLVRGHGRWRRLVYMLAHVCFAAIHPDAQRSVGGGRRVADGRARHDEFVTDRHAKRETCRGDPHIGITLSFERHSILLAPLAKLRVVAHD